MEAERSRLDGKTQEYLLCRHQTINCKKNTNTILNFYDGFQVEVEFYGFKRIKLMLKVCGGKSCCRVIGRPKQKLFI